MSVRTDTVNLVVNVNGSAAQNELNNLRKRAADLTFEMKNNLKKGTQEYIAAAGELKKVTAEMGTLKQSIGLAALSQKELTAEIKKLNALRSSVTPFSKEYKDLSVQIEAANKRLYDVKNNVQGLASVFSRVKDEVKQFGVLAASYLGFQFITTQFQNIIQGAGKLSDQLADLRRVAGLTADEATQLSSALGRIDTRTSTSGLRDIAIVAGKLGVAKDDIYGFTKAVDQLVVALGDELGNADEITTQLGKILNVFDGKVTGENITYLGNAIVDLANKGVATGGFIVDFTQRLSGIAKTANIGLPALLGLGAGLEETGAKVESASTAISKLVNKIAVDIPAAAKIAGATSADEIAKFTDLFAKKPEEALLQYAAGLQKNKASFAEIASSFKDAGESGARVITTLATLGVKTDFFREKMKEAGTSIKETSAITSAFELKNQTLGATLDKLGKQFYAFVQSSGISTFLKSAVEDVSSFIGVLKDLPKTISDNKAAFLTLVAGIAVYNAAMIKSAIVTTALKIETIANTLANKAAAIATGIIEAAQASYIVVTNLLTGKIKLATAAQRLWNIASILGAGAIGLLIVAGAALIEVLGTILKDNSALAIQMKAQKALAEEAAKNYGDQVNKLQLLKRALEDTNSDLETKKKAYQELIAMHPEFAQTLKLDIDGHLQGVTAIDEFIAALKRKGEAEAAQALSNQKNQEILLLEQEKYNKALKEEGVIKALGHGSVAYQSDIAAIDEKIKELKTAKEFFDKKILEALGGSGSVTPPADTAGPGKQAITEDPSVAARRAALQKKLDETKAFYEKLDALDIAGQNKNLALQKKYQAELDALDHKQNKTGSTNSEYARLKKEAEDFYKQIQKLKEDSANLSKSTDEKELIALENKYKELQAKALEFYRKNLVSRAKYNEEEKALAEAFNNELAALQKKQFEVTSANEYDRALKDTKDYFDQQRNIEGQSYAEGKQSKAQYDAEIYALDVQEKGQLVQVAQDYSGTVKKAAEDVTSFTKDQQKQQTDDAIAQAEARIKTAKEEALAKAQLAVIAAPKGSRQRDDAQKALLQLQFQQDTEYLDKKSEAYKLAETQLNDALAQIDDDATQRRLQAIDEATQQMLSIAGNFITALNNLDQRELQRDTALNNAKKNNYKKQLDAKLISQKQYDKKVAEADAELDKKKKELDLKAFKRQQALAITAALINGALAVTATLSARPGLADIFTLGVARAIQVGLVVAATAAQVAAIATQAPPQAAKGGWFKKGKKHSEGGIQMEIERDEAVMQAKTMMDNNRYSLTGTPAQITSKLNSMHGGESWAEGATLQMPAFRRTAPQLNPNLPRIMEQGGVVRPLFPEAAKFSTKDLENVIETKIDHLINETRSKNENLRAVYVIKEAEAVQRKYNAAKRASGLG